MEKVTERCKRQALATLSDLPYWFDGTAPSMKQYRSRLRLMRKQGSKLVPSWGDYIRLDE
ncbi:hypothetical protein [Saccharothrix variisporea]|uniref:hypothetical protein n=1 Tax=Saccharothrix variisporea TaxID=543527 RepID=UPI000EACBE3E|nr:hypothetical protein [Saccharothrix variisporea]